MRPYSTRQNNMDSSIQQPQHSIQLRRLFQTVQTAICEGIPVLRECLYASADANAQGKLVYVYKDAKNAEWI